MTHTVLIGLGILIAVLTVVAALGLLPSLRIVPDAFAIFTKPG